MSSGRRFRPTQPRFYPADEAIFIGAAVLAETARVTAMALGG